ncbi:glycosyltransferase family 1 protein [Atlantibacter subterraneus]|nr:glycosyltransferase family 1 protein [Atlantibacter subterranea]
MFRRIEMFGFKVLRYFFPKAASVIRAIYAHQTTAVHNTQEPLVHSNAMNIMELVSYHNIFNAVDKKTQRIAVVSPMPPAQTGIADYTLISFVNNNIETHFYGDYPNIDTMLEHKKALSQDNPSQFFAVDTYVNAAKMVDYSLEVFVLGNSDHNLKMAVSLLTTKKSSAPRALYLHDLCLFNLLFLVCIELNLSYVQVLRDAYAHKDPELLNDKNVFDIHHLMDNGIYALKPFVDRGLVDEMWVNSSAARQLAETDLGSVTPIVIKETFLPVPTIKLERSENLDEDYIRIGSFGLPNAGKDTPKIIKAVQKLVNKGIKIKLIIAGYLAEDFFKNTYTTVPDFIEIHDSPDEEELFRLMGSIDLALQLRKKSLGESSGVVPQLLTLKKNVIVTRIGSFVDYGEAVRMVEDSLTADELASVINDELLHIGGRTADIDNYLNTHGVKDFINFVNGCIPHGIEK